MALVLSGCLGGEGGGLAFASRDTAGAAKPQAAPTLRQVALANGRVVVQGPRGYCVDPASVRKTGGGFVLLASCESLGGQAGEPVEPAVMTVSILPRRTGTRQPKARDLVDALAPARARMLRDGDGVAIAHLDAGGDSVIPGGDPAHWRAAMVVNGHLVGLAVYGREGSPVAGAAGERLIRDLSETLRTASPQKEVSPPAARQAPRSDPRGAARSGGGLTSLFGGLFPKRG